MREVAPDAVVNMLTAIPARLNPRRIAAEFAATNRLRTEGTRHLLDAARDIGVHRVIAQGLAYAYEPSDAGIANEDEPLWRRPPAAFAPVVAALRELETSTSQAGGTVLRLGHLYGPGTMFAADGSFVADVRAGKVPLVGGGASVFSFIHVDDVATAVLAALDRETPGVLNVVDDDPAPIRGLAAGDGRAARRAAAPADAARGGPARGRRMGRGLPRRAARGGQRASQARAGLASPAPVVAGGPRPRADGAGRAMTGSLPSAVFEEHRRVLLGLAYRLLGSVWDAEDVVQDAYLRWMGADRTDVREPRGFLMTIVTRLALDHLRSARVTRTAYVGPWLPEPVATDALGPLDTVELRDTVSFATVHLMERLSPPERAVFVLREAFELPYEEIAETVGLSAAACRQTYHRAHAHLSGGHHRFPATSEEHARLLEGFLHAARDGDLHSLSRDVRRGRHELDRRGRTRAPGPSPHPRSAKGRRVLGRAVPSLRDRPHHRGRRQRARRCPDDDRQAGATSGPGRAGRTDPSDLLRAEPGQARRARRTHNTPLSCGTAAQGRDGRVDLSPGSRSGPASGSGGAASTSSWTRSAGSARG